MVVVPKPDKIVTYAISSSESSPSSSSSNAGALYLYGDPSSSKMALLCAGFPDDHTVFQPFAKALSSGGVGGFKDSSDGVFVGVMCLPGFDDRPRDNYRNNVPWTKHKPDGYTFDEMTYAVREAAKVLRKESTNNKKNDDDDDTNNSSIYNKHTPLTGIFHDWGVIPGAMWANRLEKEAEDLRTTIENTSGGDNGNKAWTPDRMVFFDVLPYSSSITTHNNNVFDGLTCKGIITTSYYKIAFAISFLLQRHVSKYLAAICAVSNILIMKILHLAPCYEFDTSKALYENGNDKNKDNRSLFRLIYMAYPYWILLRNMFFKLPGPELHSDLKATPILYMYGPKKRTQFHHFGTLELLKREEKENRSLSRAVAVEGTGHYLYIQRQDECLEHVLDFMNAENTFVVA